MAAPIEIRNLVPGHDARGAVLQFLFDPIVESWRKKIHRTYGKNDQPKGCGVNIGQDIDQVSSIILEDLVIVFRIAWQERARPLAGLSRALLRSKVRSHPLSEA